jgi:glycyl-tRNA synthetase
MSKYPFDEIVSHLQVSGYVFPGSQIYGGLANAWDYGPLGALLKQNVKNAWWKKFVQEPTTNVGVDPAIIMNTKVWQTTGHVANFSDPLIDCKSCKSRHRADDLIESQAHISVDGWSNEQLMDYIKNNEIVCPKCGNKNFTDIRQFQLMFKTHMGVTEDSKSEVYLRPETAQGIFVNFANVVRSQRRRLPLGICDIGKAFRNEITPGNFTFRTREFEQMEMEFFCKPGDDLEWFAYWKKYCWEFLLSLGIQEDKLRYRDHDKAALAFYSKATTDIEYDFPFGWGELWGIADRTDYDLSRHMQASGENLTYTDPKTNENYVPYCVEPSVGVDRLMLVLMCDSYEVQQLEKDTRVVMHLNPFIAPYKAAILPLSKQLSEKATELEQKLAKEFSVVFDETGSIGKRYRRQDAIGTPFCITYDFDSETDGCVTIRERDSMEQVRLPIAEVESYLKEHIKF